MFAAMIGKSGTSRSHGARKNLLEIARGQNVAATTSGAGLGLCLVERNLRALGGSVTVKSAPGGGTSFTLHLPVS